MDIPARVTPPIKKKQLICMRTFEVYGYRTKSDLDNYRFEPITDLNCTKQEAETIAAEEINSGKWYAVKWQSDDREEIKILTINPFIK